MRKSVIKILSYTSILSFLFLLLPDKTEAGINRIYRIRMEGEDFIEECADYPKDCLNDIIITPNGNGLLPTSN